MISLKLLAHQLLLGCPSDGNSSFKHLGTKTEDTKQIFLPRELSRIKLAFAAPVVLFVSSNNPGASKTAARLQKGMVGLSVTSEKPTQFGSGKKLRQKATAGGIGQLVGSGRSLLAGLVASVGGSVGGTASPAAGPATAAAGQATHMLLYLNEETFVGPEGALLAAEVRTAQHQHWPEPLIFAQCPSPSPGPEPNADVHVTSSSPRQVRSARAAEVPLLLLHENDKARGGCLFEKFFQTTPQARRAYRGYTDCRGHTYVLCLASLPRI